MRTTLLAFCTLLPFAPLLASHITFESKTYSSVANRLMGDHGQNAVYRVPLVNVDSYLPTMHDIQRRSIKFIEQRIIPGKSFLNILRHYRCHHQRISQTTRTTAFFAALQEEKTHTYVILDEALIFTESTDHPEQENIKDWLTKHYLLAKLGKQVRFSGEFHIYKNPQNDQIFVVFDNSSGTYKPDGNLLPNLNQLLVDTFIPNQDPESKEIFFVTKKYNQKIDKAKLFAHEEQPFLQL